MNFNRKEVKDIILTIFSISVIASLKDFPEGGWISTFILSFFLISVSLMIKLTAHKLTAKKYDCTAVYKFDYNLFLIALLIGLISNSALIFAVMGSITVASAYISRLGHKFGNVTLREKGLINLSGPMMNIILALISIILHPVNPVIFQELLRLNVFMSMFSLIPLPPLDGSKVIWWNRLVWLICFAITLFLFFLGRTVLFTIIGIVLLIIITFILWEKMF